MAQFKSRVTKRLWKIPALRDTPIWQRNYYEHIIRNERELKSTTDYINANPLLWEQDDENPLQIQPQGRPARF
jgi:REP element-mobilizing transposase RayT